MARPLKTQTDLLAVLCLLPGESKVMIRRKISKVERADEDKVIARVTYDSETETVYLEVDE